MVDIKLKKNPLSLQLDPDDFLPASEDEKKQLDIMRESTTFWKDALKRFSKNKVAMVAAVVILLVIICAFVVPNFYPYEYDQQIRGSENLWPMQYSEEEQALIDSGESVFPHIFGTDKLGRDLGIRVLTGARVSLLVGLIASALVLLIGSIYGSVAGYFGGKVDLIMMRIVDILTSLPSLLYTVLIMLLFGSDMGSVILALCFTSWIGTARVVRSEVMRLKHSEYVLAARLAGANTRQLLVSHLLPNAMGPIIVSTAFLIPNAIFSESFLSFLGIGIKAPMASWGTLANDAIPMMLSQPHQMFFPVLGICITMFSFNFIGDGLRDALDPRLKK